MQTNFTDAQLADPQTANSEKILRKCVHCGLCTATCPTYLINGDELDSPRGRIYLIKDMLENDRPADEKTVKHIDRCLSCLACVTTCPSGVNYMHLIDHARTHINKTYKRPLLDRLYRSLLANTLPFPSRVKLAIKLAQFGKPFANLLEKSTWGKPIAAMLKLAPRSSPSTNLTKSSSTFSQNPKARVAMLIGCVQGVMDEDINRAATELLSKNCVDVINTKGESCCGALVHHMGLEDQAIQSAKNNIDVWMNEIEEGLDAILITTSGCGTTIKNYGHLLRDDPDYSKKAETISNLAKDITEFLSTLVVSINENSVKSGNGIRLAYHSACSLQHGQKINDQPRHLLKNAGFDLVDIPESHLCCGSAGAYNILQPEMADMLKKRKVANIKRVKPDLIAAGNLGCITQIASGLEIPIFHTVQLLNWAYGGETKPEIRNILEKLKATSR